MVENNDQVTNDFIPFNKPLKLGSESNFIDEVLAHGVLAGNGVYTRKCHLFFEECFGFVSTFLTSSCSQALQIAASLCDLKDGDEVIVPSYGYVTTASSFNVNGARLVFVDSEERRPHICPIDIEQKISSKTKVLVVIHYAGVACDMDRIMKLVDKHNLLLIEDCAQAINVTYDNKYLGSFGDFATFSFHETKNIHCGEGGLLVVNNSSKVEKARQIWQEGTNRYDFETGLTKKYEWVVNGSSYQPSELNAAFLFGQLQKINRVTKERLEKWNLYSSSFKELNSTSSLQPNILLVIADDMGVDAAPGYSEGSRKPNMPNLSSLAASGVTFTNAWAYPQCAPTRASMLTGKYGYHTNVLNVNSHGTIQLSEKSLHTYIKEQTNDAYATSLIGKWHLSNGANDAESMGVDYYAGYLNGRPSPNYNSWAFTEGGQTNTINEYNPTKLTDLATNWMSQQTKPWFCWLAYAAPHTPYHAPPAGTHSQGDLTGASNETLYMAMMENLDYELGRINTHLGGNWDNTIVIFIGDNGTPNAVIQSPFSSGSGKGSLYQGGINVPLIVGGGTGVTRSNVEDESLVNSTDIFSTVAEIAGAASSTYQDSFSFKSLLSSANSGLRTYNYTEVKGTSLRKSGFTIRDDRYKYIEFDNGNSRFYDLDADPYEGSNIRTGQMNASEVQAKADLISQAALIRI